MELRDEEFVLFALVASGAFMTAVTLDNLSEADLLSSYVSYEVLGWVHFLYLVLLIPLLVIIFILRWVICRVLSGYDRNAIS